MNAPQQDTERTKRPPLVRGCGRNLVRRLRDSIRFYERLHRDHGPIVRYRVLHLEVCGLFDAELIREVLDEQRDAFDKGRALQLSRGISNPTVITASGPEHRRRRRLIQPFFHRTALDRYVSTIVHRAAARRDAWHEGTAVDICSEIRELVTDIAIGVFFGDGIDVDADDLESAAEYVQWDFAMTLVPVSLSYNPTLSTPLGFVARVAPSWGGEAMGGARALWGRESMAGMAHGGLGSGNRLDGGRLRAAGGALLRGDAAGRLYCVRARTGLPGRLRPRRARPRETELRAGASPRTAARARCSAARTTVIGRAALGGRWLGERDGAPCASLHAQRTSGTCFLRSYRRKETGEHGLVGLAVRDSVLRNLSGGVYKPATRAGRVAMLEFRPATGVARAPRLAAAGSAPARGR